MDEPEPNILIGDPDGQRVTIRTLGRTHPEYENYWDGNWVSCEIAVLAGGFLGRCGVCLRSDEFQTFHTDVRRLAASLEGKAVFSSLEQQLGIVLEGDGKGHIMVVGTARDSVGAGNKLSFSFEIDQTYLPTILRSLEDVLARFPVIGDPRAP